MTRRKKLPVIIESQVLVRSKRRCCLCFGLHREVDEKAGQIAHLDHNPNNNDEDNLAFLCFEHHDRYDSRTSQSKGITEMEVRLYRNQLYKTFDLIFQEPLRTALTRIERLEDKVDAIRWATDEIEQDNRALLLSLLGSVQGWYNEIIDALAKLRTQENQFQDAPDTVMRLGFAYVWRRSYLPNIVTIIDILSERSGMQSIVDQVDSFVDLLTRNGREGSNPFYPLTLKTKRWKAMAT